MALTSEAIEIMNEAIKGRKTFIQIPSQAVKYALAMYSELPKKPKLKEQLKVIQPMLTSTGDKPFVDGNWLFEIKYDGIRIIAYKQNDDIRLLTRNYKNVSDVFPEIVNALKQFRGNFIMDGEITVKNKYGLGEFHLAQRRITRTDPDEIKKGIEKFPAYYTPFDLLYLDCGGTAFQLQEPVQKFDYDSRSWTDTTLDEGEIVITGPTQRYVELNFGDIRGIELRGRKVILNNYLELSFNLIPNNDIWSFMHINKPHYLVGNGEDLYGTVLHNGHEGMIAKRLDSKYESGKRSDNWLKIFPRYKEVYQICGYTKIDSILKGGIGALHLCEETIYGFIYRGKVGTGFTKEERTQLLVDLVSLRELNHEIIGLPKSKNTDWVEPCFNCLVEFKKKTPDGKLRHPVFLKIIDNEIK